MTPFVVTHVAFGTETLATLLGAGEGPLVVVDSHVDAQVLFLREGFSTVRTRTLEWLSAVV